MDLSIISKTSKDLGRVLTKNSPTILTALGVGGLITTVILAVKATVKAQEILHHEAEFRFDEWQQMTGEHKDTFPVDPIFSTEEIFELTWREYIPTAAMSVATIACMIGSNHINLRRNAALASLFSITETTLREYQAQVVEKIGDKQEEKLRGEIAQKKLDQNPADEKTVIITGKGQYLCYDSFSGRYFRSDVETIRRAENSFNQRLIRTGWLNINEFYDELGLEPIELGDEMGWIAERAMLEPRYSTKLTKEQEPCLVIDYMAIPVHI